MAETTTNAETTNTEALVEALGDLINASSTLQSVLLGGVGGVERERALAHFDRRVEAAASARRACFGEPSPDSNAAVEPVAEPDNTPTSVQRFRVTGQT